MSEINKNFNDNTPSLAQFLGLLDEVRELTIKLEKVSDELSKHEKSEEISEERIVSMRLVLKEVETANEYVKNYLDRTFKWITTVMAVTISVLIALISLVVSLLIKHMESMPQ